MKPSDYQPCERIVMKTASEFSEKWIQDLIRDNPAVLGIGSLEFRNAEKQQPMGGRVDLILSEPESDRRYEVEIQLGATDESHIIRTIEYWDNERKRYPQFEHCAVIVAEDITSRFFNVISLFNRSIPLIAIQMRLLKVADKVTLAFTTVLDESAAETEPDPDPDKLVDRSYWVRRASEESVQWAELMFEELVRPIVPDATLNFRDHYIGIARGGKANNFVVFKPKRELLHFHFKHEYLPEVEELIKQAGLTTLAFDRRHRFFRVSLASRSEIMSNKPLLEDLVQRAYRYMNE